MAERTLLQVLAFHLLAGFRTYDGKDIYSGFNRLEIVHFYFLGQCFC